jgi:hypothetical protein
LGILSDSNDSSKYADFAVDIRSAEYPDFSVQGGLRGKDAVRVGKIASLSQLGKAKEEAGTQAQ